jgi:predicted phage-related endonuclease
MSDLSIDTHPQGSPAWLAARAGCVTGSRAADVVAVRKDGTPTAARADYLAQLVAELLTGEPQETGVVTPWMTRGTELEPQARLRLEALLDAPVFESGFVWRVSSHYFNTRLGCSVDGYVGRIEDAIVELKCPKPATHLRYLRDRVVPDAYWPQVVHNLLVTGADVCHFASYCPQMPRALQLMHVEVVRTDEAVRDRLMAYGEALARFTADLHTELTYWRDQV